MTGKMGDVCFVTIWWSDNKFEWLVGRVHTSCEGVRNKYNIFRLEFIKEVVRTAMEDVLSIMTGGEMNAHIWELDGCENEMVGE